MNLHERNPRIISQFEHSIDCLVNSIDNLESITDYISDLQSILNNSNGFSKFYNCLNSQFTKPFNSISEYQISGLSNKSETENQKIITDILLSKNAAEIIYQTKDKSTLVFAIVAVHHDIAKRL